MEALLTPYMISASDKHIYVFLRATACCSRLHRDHEPVGDAVEELAWLNQPPHIRWSHGHVAVCSCGRGGSSSAWGSQQVSGLWPLVRTVVVVLCTSQVCGFDLVLLTWSLSVL